MIVTLLAVFDMLGCCIFSGTFLRLCYWCSLGEDGAVAIADFVKQAKKLKELNLYMNDIGNGGAYKVR